MLKLTKKKTDNKSTYHSPEYKQFLILRIVNLSFIGLLLAGVILGTYFMYKNIFYTIENAEYLILTQNTPVTEVIDFVKYEKMQKAWQDKNLSTLSTINRDPFNNINATTTPKVIE